MSLFGKDKKDTKIGDHIIELPDFKGRTGTLKGSIRKDGKASDEEGSWKFVVRAAWISRNIVESKLDQFSPLAAMMPSKSKRDITGTLLLLELENGQILEAPIYECPYDIQFDKAPEFEDE